MLVADMPFEPFLNLLRTCAKDLNFHLIALLVAREADCHWAFEQLERDWASLHDVTGKKVVFITIDGDDHSPISHWGNGLQLRDDVKVLRGDYGLIAFSRNCKLLSDIKYPYFKADKISQWTQISSMEFVDQHIHSRSRAKGWRDSQSLGVSSILNALRGISELEVPCLYLELVHCGYGFAIPIANDPPVGFSFYKAFKKLLIDSDISFVNIKENSDFLQKEGDIPRSKKAANSLSWLREWIESQSGSLPEQIHTFILMALEGKAQHKDVYKVISPLRSELDRHTFSTLRAHLDRITSKPQYIRLSQGKAVIAAWLSEECRSFEQATRRIFEYESRLDMNRFETESIRNLLIAAFDDTELMSLCFDRFYPVYNERFGSGMGKAEKVQQLLDYCVRHGKLDALLELIRERNAHQYAIYIEQRVTCPRQASPNEARPGGS